MLCAASHEGRREKEILQEALVCPQPSKPLIWRQPAQSTDTTHLQQPHGKQHTVQPETWPQGRSCNRGSATCVVQSIRARGQSCSPGIRSAFNREVIRASESPIDIGQEISEQNLLCFTHPLLPRLQDVHTQQEESQSPEERCTVPHSDTFSVSFPSSWRHRRGAPQVYSAHPKQHQIYRAPSGSRSRNRHPQPG